MPEPFKNLIHAQGLRKAAAGLARVWPGFDRARFVSLSTTGLDALELKARVMQVCTALEATLPPDFVHAAQVIEAALAPVDESGGEADSGAPGLAGWILWPVGEFVARRGLADPARALATLRELTRRFTAEFAIRPFVAMHPQLAFDTLARWAFDPDPRVRRLVSEGSRPRLPWGMRLAALVADPSPTLPLLQALQDDPDEAVRRSVANHLNDIAKDHPALVAAWVERHLPSASPERRALLRHASRTLIKQGDARVLAAWGQGKRFVGKARLAVEPPRAALGGTVELTLTLASRARKPQRLVVDYAVHHVKANGERRPKVFKGWTLELQPGETRTLVKRHSLRPVTTRRYHAGRHGLSVHVNGRTVAEGHFTLSL